MSTTGNIAPVGGLNWVPDITSTGGPTPYGFLEQTLDRGQFRNDTPELTVGRADASVYTSTLGTVTSQNESQDWPILAVFRPLENPNVIVGSPPLQPYVSTASGTPTDCGLKITVGTSESPSSAEISCMKIKYSLVVNIQDPTLPKYLTKSDAGLLKSYLSGQSATLSIDWSQYPFGRIQTIDSSGNIKTWTSAATVTSNSSTSSGSSSTIITNSFVVTDYIPRTGETTIINTYTQYFATELVSGPNIQTISINNTYNVSFLTYYIYSIMLFNNVKCNFSVNPTAMLPCSYFQYAFDASFSFDPSESQISYPLSGNRPNLHVKIFSPEERIAVTGLAHSIFLNFVILSFPFSIGEFGTLYMVQFSGVAASPQTWQLILIDTIINTSTSGRVVPLDYVSIPSSTVSLILQKATSTNGSPPSANADWITLSDSLLQLSSLPTTFSPQGPFISSYLYLDPVGTINDWYRIIQTYQNGNYTSGAFQSQVYSEQSVFEMLASDNGVSATSGTITRRVLTTSSFSQNDPLQALNPLVLFVSQVETPLSSPITFGMGQWSLNFRAFVEDPNSLMDTHIFARFWLQPTTETLSQSNPYQYRSQTEFYFKTNPITHTSTLVFGTPTNLDECLVSMPLPNQSLTLIQMSRYVDSVQGVSSTAGYTLPFGANIQAQVVVALYTVSYPYSGTLDPSLSPYPTLELEINPLYGTLETTILQYLSNAITPVNSETYTDSYYTPLVSPLTVTYDLVGGGSDSPFSPGYVEYQQHFLTQNITTTSISGLMALEKSVNSAQFYIPYTTISLTEHNQSSAVYADFATNATSLDLGMVTAGIWNFTLNINASSIDTPSVGADYKLDGFLVASNGTVTDYVFRTGFITGVSSTGTGSIALSITAQTSITYEINGGDSTQFVLRLWAYPYSRSGNGIDITTLKTNLGTIPFGARVDSLTINSNTLNTLTINQIASFQGSPAYYEDLPLVPPLTYDSSQFIFSSDPSLDVTQFLEAGGIDYAPGTLYSPVWSNLTWPANMEINMSASGFDQQYIWLRTVPSTSTSKQQEFSVTSVENPLTTDVHCAYGVQNTIVSTMSYNVNAMALTGTAISHYLLQSPFQTPVQNVLISGQNNGSTYLMEGKNPNFSFLKQGVGGNNFPGSMLAVVIEIDEQTTTSFSVNINAYDGAAGAWSNPVPDGTFGTLHRLVEGLTFPSICQSNTNNMFYIVGYCDQAIFLKEVNFYDVGNDSPVVPGEMFLVDGNTTPNLSGDQSYTVSTAINGTAVNTFASVLVDYSGRVYCAYSLNEYPGCIFVKVTYTGQSFDGQAYQILNLPQLGISGSTAINCCGLALSMHTTTQTIYLAFWCAGKIFITTVNVTPTGLSAFDQITLVAGGIDFTDSSNQVNAAFGILASKNQLRVDRTDTESDVPQQRCGFYISENFPNQGDAFVYYVNANNQLCVRYVKIGSTTSAPYIFPASVTS